MIKRLIWLVIVFALICTPVSYSDGLPEEFNAKYPTYCVMPKDEDGQRVGDYCRKYAKIFESTVNMFSDDIAEAAADSIGELERLMNEGVDALLADCESIVAEIAPTEVYHGAEARLSSWVRRIFDALEIK